MTDPIHTERHIHIANGGRISASWLHAHAVSIGRPDLAARLSAVCGPGYLRYTGEDGDVLASCWSAMGWPRDGETDRD